MPSTRTLALAAVVGATAPSAGLAAQATRQPPKPKVSVDSARKIARGVVPNGRIQSSELEHENGAWIYSFDIRVADKPGIEEVNVDANTGRVLAHEHETPAMEKAEAAADAKAARKKADSTRALPRLP